MSLATHTKLAELVTAYKAHNTASNTVPCAPDTSKFTRKVSGSVSVSINYVLYGDYYGSDKRFLVAIDAGGNYPADKLKELLELAKPLLQDIADNFDADTFILGDGRVYGIVCDKYSYTNEYAKKLNAIYM